MIKKFLPIIPARGGSKGIPKKNIVELKGKPLISYTIQAVLESNLGIKPIVSTDSDEIAEVAISLGAEVLMRPSNIAGDLSSSASVVMHVLESLEDRINTQGYTDFIFLQPTSPLRSNNHINEAINLYLNSEQRCLVSLVEENNHPYKSFILNENNQIVPLFGNEFLSMPRQQLPKIYRQNGAIYILDINTFMEKQSFHIAPATMYLMEYKYSIDIDTNDDLFMASLYLRNHID